MPSWWEAVGDTVKGLYCNVAEFGEWYAGGVATLLDETKLDELAEFQLEYAQWANRKFCGKKPSTSVPAYLAPPFTGGQCLVRYFVKVTVFYKRDAVPEEPMREQVFTGGQYDGKLVGADIVQAVTTPLSDAYVRFNYASGTLGQNFFISRVFQDSAFWGVRIYSVSVENLGRVDGLSDDCGSLSGSVPPNNDPLVIVRDIDYEDEDGNPQTDEDVTFTLGTPVLEQDGSISVPYEVCKDDFCVKGKMNLGDDITLDDKYPSEDLLPPSVQLDSPLGDGSTTPESELDGEELSEEDKEKTPILGVFIKSQKTNDKSKATEIFMDDDAPVILAPNIGFVRFRILHGEESGWLSDIPFKSVNAYIPVPDKMEAVSCEVAWQSGWEGKYILQRGHACCKECEESDE